MRYYITLSILCIFVACSDYTPTTSNVNLQVANGMVNVLAKGKHVTLGTNSVNAKANERQQMKVRFDYDFLLDEHEVTCKDFNVLMQKSFGLKLKCENENLPATNITFFDAALFANEKSKSENLDTAYIYKSAKFDSENHCTSLENFSFDANSNAYRLPTEAEWMLSASQEWNPKNAWTSENSNYTLHEVCTSKAKGSFCDMAGNAMEWVNDWLGNFSDTTISNFTGALDGGALGLRIVKGGSFRNSANSIELYSRGDIYAITSSTKANYVGFRLAKGSIPNAIYMQNGNVKTSSIYTLATAQIMRALLKTYAVKLAFRDDISGNLNFINYAGGGATLTEIVDTLDVYHPEISPDGKRVAFCTSFEGISKNSEIYVRDLNANGSNLVKLDVKNAAIPRWKILDGDTVIVYVTDAGDNSDEATFKASSTWQVKFENGKFGTPKKLFNGAYHDGISEDKKLAVTGARLLRARVNSIDTIWYNGEQACNASLSKDSSKRTLFLDFGSNTGREFVGEKYGTHERILVADSIGKLIQSVVAPSGYSFDHSEWVNSDFAIATLTNANGAHTKIVLINMNDASITELAEGDELWHPCLWVKQNSTNIDNGILDLDSAGVYLKEPLDLIPIQNRDKMERYWKHLDDTKILLYGSSRTMYGVNPDLLPEAQMLNMGISGIDPDREFYFIKNYAYNHAENLKAIVMSLDLDGWHVTDDLHTVLFICGSGYEYDANHNFWADGVPTGFVEAVENGYAIPQSFSDRGRLESDSRSWESDGIQIAHDTINTEIELQVLDARINEFMGIVDMFAEKNIYIIGIIFPFAPQYKNTGSFGRYSLRRSLAKQKIAQLDSLSKTKKYFVLMDENKMGNHDYTDEMAYNMDHLSTLGANKLTVRLDSLLKTLTW